MDGPPGSQKKYVRRNHRKSRAGCQNCKRRRVKCDEEKPECANCIRFSIKCDYVPVTEHSPNDHASSSPSPQTSSASVEPVAPRRRGRPRKNWDAINAAANAAAANGDNLSTISEDPKTDPVSVSLATVHEYLNPEDLYLLWHYVMQTSATLSGDTLGHYFYQTSALKVGFEHKLVLHFPLALAALHLARFNEPKREHYNLVAQRHYTAGIEELTKVLPYVNSSNCQGLYVSSVLVCIYTFAQAPKPGEFLIFSEAGGPALWLPLLRGVRTIIQTAGADAIFSGVLAPPATESDVGEMPGPRLRPKKPRAVLDWRRPLAELQEYIKSNSSDLGEAKANLFLRALDGMLPSYEASFADSPAEVGKPHPAESRTVMIWFYHMDPDFVAFLHEKEPLALVILAHFTVLLKTMEDRWFMEGWVEHILSGIRAFVDQRYVGWLRWPLEQAGIGDRMDISYVTGA